MRKMKKKITTAIKNNFDLLEEANKRISELEETIILNTCREITKPYCPMRIADLDQIKENKKQIDVLKLNQTDGTPNQNFVAIHILKNGFTQIGLKSDNWFKKIEVVLRELHELMRGLVSDLQDSDSLSKATIECYEGKLVKNLEKLDPKSIHNDPILKECQEKFKEMEKQTEEREVCEACLYEKTFDTKICAICIPNSNKSQFKPKDSRGEKARSLKIRTAGRGKASLNESGGDVGSNPTENSKLPDLICPFCGRKLIRYKQAWICGHGCTKPALKPIDDLEKDSRSEKELPNRETVFYEASYGINGKPNVSSSKLPEPQCNHFGCKKVGIYEFNGIPYCEKHYNDKHPTKKATAPEKELYELYLKDGGQYYFKKITHPFTEYNNMVHLATGKIVVNRSDKQELIEGVQDKLEFLRDKVLEAPILSGSVQDLRDHIHDLKDLVVKNIEEYEGMLK